MNTRVLITAMLASIAAISCGGGEGASASRPTNPAVTIRFIGPDGNLYAPKRVELFRLGSGGESQPMKTWEDGVTTDLGVELVPGDIYDVLTGSSGERDLFEDTALRFTAPEGPVDLGTLDLRALGLTMISPARGAVLTSYPVEFSWTAYTNTAADQELNVCERLGSGCAGAWNFSGTSYSLTEAEKTESIQGRAASWWLYYTFTTTEGYEVRMSTLEIPFTLPE